MHLRMLSLCVPTLRSLWPIPTNSMCSFVIMSLLLKIGIKMTRKWWSLLYWNSFGRTSLLFLLAPPAKSFHFNFSHSDRIMNELGSKQAFFVIFFSFQRQFYRKIVDISRIWTRIVIVEGEHTDHFTTNPAWE